MLTLIAFSDMMMVRSLDMALANPIDPSTIALLDVLEPQRESDEAPSLESA
jgi:hypothetical protein